MDPRARTRLFLNIILFTICMGVPATPSIAFTAHQKNKKITLTVKDAAVRDVFVFLGKEAGTNIVMSEAVKGTVTLSLEKVRVWTAMKVVAKLKQLELMRVQNVLLIMSREEYLRELERRRHRR
jgi:type II secretory pathway component HofQ